MKGALAEKEKNRLHKDGLNQGVAEINALLKPKLVVVDGIIGQEGLGPVFGDPVEMDLILAGADSVAVDTVLCRIMEIDPKEVLCIRYAEEMGLGTSRMDEIEIFGKPIGRCSAISNPRGGCEEDRSPGVAAPLERNLLHRMPEHDVQRDQRHAVEEAPSPSREPDRDRRRDRPDPQEVDRSKLVLVGACTAKRREEGIRWAPAAPPELLGDRGDHGDAAAGAQHRSEEQDREIKPTGEDRPGGFPCRPPQPQYFEQFGLHGHRDTFRRRFHQIRRSPGRAPSAGLFPCLGGITLFILSAVNLLKGWREGGGAAAPKFFPARKAAGRSFFCSRVCFAYGFALTYLGFFLTTFLFMLFLLKAIEPQRWARTLITSFSVSAAAYMLFEVLLKVQLPLGIMENLRLSKLF